MYTHQCTNWLWTSKTSRTVIGWFWESTSIPPFLSTIELMAAPTSMISPHLLSHSYFILFLFHFAKHQEFPHQFQISNNNTLSGWVVDDSWWQTVRYKAQWVRPLLAVGQEAENRKETWEAMKTRRSGRGEESYLCLSFPDRQTGVDSGLKRRQ